MRGALATVPLFLALTARPVAADPQGNAGLTIGGAGVGSSGAVTDGLEFHLGARGDIMFAREDPYDFGLGPYVEVGTFAFDEIQFGGGVTSHLPIHETLPFVLSAGAFARYGDTIVHGTMSSALEPGLSAALFWGSRSYNYHSNYIVAGGLLVGFRQSLGDSRESSLLVAAQLDFAVMALPAVALVNLMRGPTSDARPID